MSLILEALRKSEAERRRGQTPDLLAEPAPVKRPSPATLPRWWPWAAAVATVLIVGWLGRGAFTSNPDATDAQSRATVAQPEPAAAARDEEAAPAAQAIARPPAPTPNAAPSVATTAAPPPVTSAPATTPPTMPAAPAPAPAEAPAPAAGKKPAVATAATAPAPVIAMPPTPAPARQPPPQAFTSPDTVLRLSELSAEERQQLPPLKISMHMWAPEPAQRFVIIDGNRMIEGDRVGSAVIEAITSDGVTLAWQGRRIQLPIR
jgi:general secretion pathway protein B